MNIEDIIRMAKNEYGIYAFTAESLAEFATIIAAAECEACAKICADIAMHREMDSYGMLVAHSCANEILARGEKLT